MDFFGAQNEYLCYSQVSNGWTGLNISYLRIEKTFRFITLKSESKMACPFLRNLSVLIQGRTSKSTSIMDFPYIKLDCLLVFKCQPINKNCLFCHTCAREQSVLSAQFKVYSKYYKKLDLSSGIYNRLQLQSNIISMFKIKFIYSEKATEFGEIFPLFLTTVNAVKSKGKILQNLVAFSEYMNFTTHCIQFLTFCRHETFFIRLFLISLRFFGITQRGSCRK